MPVVTALESSFRELRQLDETLVRELRQRNTEQAASAVYADGARLHVPGRPVIVGREKIRDFWLEMFRKGLIDLRMESSHLDAGHDLGFGDGVFVATIETHPGLLRTDSGTHVTVYRRQATGDWRVTAQSFTFDSPISVP